MPRPAAGFSIGLVGGVSIDVVSSKHHDALHHVEARCATDVASDRIETDRGS
jgi:hypothetical protein